ncbi:hypothetical protein CDEST_15492 [Colletotrichum destructivum]|uniref:Uncharacterized protein n=1 Tax=Colletotrichum destructivum TaxID=34406 RepID=A0AAX4J4F9_9PEZI|nr:hypothetical protein CDEST_15399 [Colletotrichum destructivum]WQF90478.1 hypothetical protein CDEST_15492 [Colletotrichum destructivum]
MVCQRAKQAKTDTCPHEKRNHGLYHKQKGGCSDKQGFCLTCIEFFKPYDISHSTSVKRYQKYKQKNGWTRPVHPSRIPHDYLFPYTLIVVPRSACPVDPQLWPKVDRLHTSRSPEYVKGMPAPTPADFRRCIAIFKDDIAPRTAEPKPPLNSFTQEACMKELPLLPKEAHASTSSSWIKHLKIL